MQNRINDMRKVARELPRKSGVYMMKDRLGHVIYVGKAKDLRKRVGSYFQGSRKFIWAQPKIGAMVEMVREISYVETKNETEALLLEGKLIKEYKPRYNTDFTDDKQFLLVQWTCRTICPSFGFAEQKEDGAHYYGPFAQAGMLRSTLAEMRKKFGILLADAKPVRLGNGRYRLYDDARAEIFAGHNEPTLEEYHIRVEEACSFLEGRAKSWLAELREQMLRRAEAMDFEKAAELRDLSDALNKTIGRNRRFTRNWPRAEDGGFDSLERLAEKLALDSPPAIIECFDVSHVSGTFVVASMVRFRSGKPDKRAYRRFKVRAFEGNDDFRAMEEVVGRRYARLHEKGEGFPDLVVVDGGAGQVSAALKAFLILNLDAPPIIGLAKREETVVFPDKRKELKLKARDPPCGSKECGMRHRFANQFNADLRSKKIRESILDDFPGLE